MTRRGHPTILVPWIPAALVLLSLVPLAGSDPGDDWPPAHHSAHVSDFSWTPRAPIRGQAVTATLTLQNASDVDGAVLRVCRVQNYACRQPLEMQDLGRPTSQFQSTIPWDERFYRGTTEVGIAVILHLANGTEEESPTAPWPGPVDLPEGAGRYYFFALPAETHGASGLPFVALVLAVLVGLAWRPK